MDNETSRILRAVINEDDTIRQALRTTVSEAKKKQAKKKQNVLLTKEERDEQDKRDQKNKNRKPDNRKTVDRLRNRRTQPRHGTLSEYKTYGCKCDKCTKANREYNRSRNRKPCINGCGGYAWHAKGNSGRCKKCYGLSIRKNKSSND